MRGSRVLSIVCNVPLVALLAIPSSAAAGSIRKVVINDIIHGVNARHLIRVLEEAESEDAEIVLVELSTPGGLYQATREIIEAMLASERPVVVYVAPSGAHAASAGFLITIAADVAAMAPGTNTGAATPILGTGQEMGDTLRKKVESDAAAYTRSIAERRGRDPALAEQAVTEARAWTSREALEAGLIDHIASSEAELLSMLDGLTVKKSDGREVTIRTSGVAVVVEEMTTKEKVLSVVANPDVALLLGLIGLAGLYLEFSNPGMVVPGVVGALALLMAAFAFDILPVNAVGVLLLLAGIGLLVAEIFTPSFGALGAGGIVGIILGALMLFEEQPLPSPALRVSFEVVLPLALFFGALTVFLGRKIVQAQSRRPATGAEALLGMLGTARTAIERSGKVFIHGEYWDAWARAPIAEGERVKVIGVEGLRLEVEQSGSETSTRKESS
jgi:membrane-bound serine protease (ClpP class)